MLSDSPTRRSNDIRYSSMNSQSQSAKPAGRASKKKSPAADQESCPKRLGVLTKNDIRDSKIISENYSEERCEAASYDLRLNNEFLRPKKGGNGFTEKSLELETGQVLIIKKYSSAVVSSCEVLQLPRNVIGRFNLRIKIALRGIFVQMGTQVEPGYHGRLFALVHNISNEDVEIKLEEEPFFTIEFFFIGQEIENSDEHRPAYLSIKDILKPGTPFIKGSLGGLVDQAENDASDALKEAKTATSTAQQADKKISDAVSKKQFAWNIAFAALFALLASAVAPFFISLAAEKVRMTNSETEKLIDNKFDALEKSATRVQSDMRTGLSSFESEVGTLKKEIDRLKSEIDSLTRSTKQIAKEVKKTEDSFGKDVGQ